MENEDTPATEPTEWTPPSPAELAQAIERQRAQLKEVQAIIHSQAVLLHQVYNFDEDDADLGLCCDVVRDLLEQIHGTLGLVVLELQSEHHHIAPTALSHLIETPRKKLFRAWAVATAIRNLMRSPEREPSDPDLGTVMGSAVRMIDDTLDAIEPLKLGLPIPLPS